MSAKENPCRKFQANIFNKSKCQNCFKPRESHALIDEDLSQAKPVYGGWLLLAPEGTDFDNPVQRSRKWQRRFFILYEHGLLRYALDEMVSWFLWLYIAPVAPLLASVRFVLPAFQLQCSLPV
ncbi:myosin phosphatase Rho-interacting protein-like [Polypterus senegalus]|uniref:myosin phosphatase Rho-interacting protein-like n=1 Tax=Polypterus senegalus TaxID=55291 RepID=UPI0019643D91|nr:myosin phosphatase Rho-interacting protein-like [Polypterus senegalus]